MFRHRGLGVGRSYLIPNYQGGSDELEGRGGKGGRGRGVVTGGGACGNRGGGIQPSTPPPSGRGILSLITSHRI